ncbi:hypothetical protein K8T06_00350 [bacterium]|nr:hypothetical protein [bacterium]
MIQCSESHESRVDECVHVPDLKPLYVHKKRVICSRGYNLVAWQPEKETQICKLPAPNWWKCKAQKIRLLRQGLRLGIHNAAPLKDGNIIAIISKQIIKIYTSGKWRVVENIRAGNKPAFNGLEVCPNGQVYYAEYSLNPHRNTPCKLYSSDDHAESFHEVYSFPAGKIRHIHFIQWDPFEKCLWMGTGDRNSENRIMKSHDKGVTWEEIGFGSQQWRAIGLVFKSDAVYWGTDAGLDAGNTPNMFIRLNRSDNTLTVLGEIQGPCHGITSLKDGSIWFATGVEGGANEVDTSAHLWVFQNDKMIEVQSWKKDFWPAIVQISTIHFPHGLENSNCLTMVLLALKNNPETALIDLAEK